jgi:hypothetical protein
MKTAKKIKKQIKDLHTEILDKIREIVTRQQGEYLEVDDNRGSLVVGGDDQEPLVIMSIETRGKYLTANYGVYEPEGYEHLDDYNIEKLVQILEACEESPDADDET